MAITFPASAELLDQLERKYSRRSIKGKKATFKQAWRYAIKIGDKNLAYAIRLEMLRTLGWL